MTRVLFAALLLVVGCAEAARARPPVAYKIVTASERGTYFAIGQDLAKFVAPEAGIDLQVLPTVGSAANVRLLRYEPGVKMAVVQADVIQAFIDRAGKGQTAASALVAPLRVILPLYDTEIHFVVRADSPLNYLHEIKNAKINGGLIGSGAALITSTVYSMMFNTPIPEQNATFLSNEEALVKLISDKSIDVVTIAAGQPAPIIANMRPEARGFIKFLKFDEKNPLSQPILQTYFAATLHASSYPHILQQDLQTVAVGAYLVTYDFQTRDTAARMGQFATALCRNFETLQTQGHPKWREVSLSFPELGPGWTYYGPTTRAIKACVASRPAPASGRAQSCSQQEQILGLCK
ncbi:MAG: TAXI family TRAP transporter solute-binding subunit [Pseudomonadota bacterium]|nr:TAXI family TRAP transporter solute-binding subunit [Pseudomonadota bacterium]